MEEENMNKEPIFLANKDCSIIVEVIESLHERPSTEELESLEHMVPNTSEGAAEKHLPVVECNGTHVTVKVGSIFHPMTEEHSIAWVCLVTKAGCIQRVHLDSECEPVAHFTIKERDTAVAAYAYCNLHGFWKTEI